MSRTIKDYGLSQNPDDWIGGIRTIRKFRSGVRIDLGEGYEKFWEVRSPKHKREIKRIFRHRKRKELNKLASITES